MTTDLSFGIGKTATQCTRSEEKFSTAPNAVPLLKSMGLKEFLGHPIQPREHILAPILQEQSISMVYAERGIGKTMFALGMAQAIAAGGVFLGFSAPSPRRVLYIDGEMPADAMQERLRMIEDISKFKAAPFRFDIITPDLQPFMPNLATYEGQQQIRPLIEDFDVIFIDNIATLAPSPKENEIESWIMLQTFALEVRRSGRSLVFIHHAGKNGKQRGTSGREDIMDLVMRLSRPKNYRAEEGARVEVHLEKARHIAGSEAAMFEAQFNKENGWIRSNILEDQIAQIVSLKAAGCTYDEIEKRTGVSRSRANRIVLESRASHPTSQS